MKMTTNILAIAALLSSTVLAQLVEQPARVRKISYDKKAKIIGIKGVHVKVETAEISDENGFVTLKISPNNDGTYVFRQIDKLGYTLIAPKESQLHTEKMALNPHTIYDIILVPKRELQREKERIKANRIKNYEAKIQELQQEIEQASEEEQKRALRAELEQHYNNYNNIIAHIEKEADLLARTDYMSLSEIDVKNINFKKDGKADELIAFNKSLLPADHEQKAKELPISIKDTEKEITQKRKLQQHRAKIYQNIAEGHQLNYNNEEAAKYLMLRSLINPEHYDYSMSYGQFCELYLADYPKSFVAYQNCLKIAQKSPNKPQALIESQLKLAHVYARAGHFLQATKLLQQAHDALSKQQDKHAKLLIPYHAIQASLLSTRQQDDKAIQALLQALQLAEQELGTEHAQTAILRAELGHLYTLSHDFSLARQQLAQAGKSLEIEWGTEHPYTLRCQDYWGYLLLQEAKLQQAENSLYATLSLREKVLGKQHPDTAESYKHLAQLLLKQGKSPQAQQYLKQALRIEENILGSEHPRTQNTQKLITP